jgi:hypothetical protein
MTKDQVYTIQMTIPAGFDNIEGSMAFPTAYKKVLLVFVNGKQYDLVYRPPSGRQVRYISSYGRFVMDEVVNYDRRLTITIRK